MRSIDRFEKAPFMSKLGNTHITIVPLRNRAGPLCVCPNTSDYLEEERLHPLHITETGGGGGL